MGIPKDNHLIEMRHTNLVSRVTRDERLPSRHRRRRGSHGWDEGKAVVDYFLETLDRENLRVLEVTRLENPRVRSCFRAGSCQRVLFHGCGSQEKEDSIIRIGFQLSHAVSRPHGTWLAYNASLSDR